MCLGAFVVAVLCGGPLYAEGTRSVEDCERSKGCIVVRKADGDPIGMFEAGESQSIEPPVPVYPDLMSEVPAPLVALGESTGCRVPTRRPKHGPPAWVFELAAHQGFIGWCRMEPEVDNSVSTGFLVSLNSDQHPWASCPSYIRLPYSEASSILVVEVRKMALAGFCEPGTDGFGHELVPADDTVTPRLVIDLGDDGAGNIILCHHGRWIMNGDD
jgi:hypothetical protein